MVNKRKLMGYAFIFLMTIYTAQGAYFQSSKDVIGDHESVSTLFDTHIE